jgi:hypothetical protein
MEVAGESLGEGSIRMGQVIQDLQWQEDPTVQKQSDKGISAEMIIEVRDEEVGTEVMGTEKETGELKELDLERGMPRTAVESLLLMGDKDNSLSGKHTDLNVDARVIQVAQGPWEAHLLGIDGEMGAQVDFGTEATLKLTDYVVKESKGNVGDDLPYEDQHEILRPKACEEIHGMMAIDK